MSLAVHAACAFIALKRSFCTHTFSKSLKGLGRLSAVAAIGCAKTNADSVAQNSDSSDGPERPVVCDAGTSLQYSGLLGTKYEPQSDPLPPPPPASASVARAGEGIQNKTLSVRVPTSAVALQGTIENSVVFYRNP